jgi:hypothetical protein
MGVRRLVGLEGLVGWRVMGIGGLAGLGIGGLGGLQVRSCPVCEESAVLTGLLPAGRRILRPWLKI